MGVPPERGDLGNYSLLFSGILGPGGVGQATLVLAVLSNPEKWDDVVINAMGTDDVVLTRVETPTLMALVNPFNVRPGGKVSVTASWSRAAVVNLCYYQDAGPSSQPSTCEPINEGAASGLKTLELPMPETPLFIWIHAYTRSGGSAATQMFRVEPLH